jgi:uncharacterized membrane-anchored protein
MNDATKQALSKVPAVTLGFWVIKCPASEAIPKPE